jgi:hypothetical protein
VLRSKISRTLVASSSPSGLGLGPQPAAIPQSQYSIELPHTDLVARNAKERSQILQLGCLRLARLVCRFQIL